MASINAVELRQLLEMVDAGAEFYVYLGHNRYALDKNHIVADGENNAVVFCINVEHVDNVV